MRILYLSHYFPPEFGAAAARAHGMSRWLARFGHDVTVITAFPNYLLARVPEAYRGRRWVREEMDGVTVYRSWLYTSSKRSNWRRMANYLSFAASVWWHGRKLDVPFDVVIASSPPLFLGPIGVALARYFHAPLVFDVRDMWPEIAVKLGVFREGSLMERGWRMVADYTYHRAAAILPVTQRMQEDMIALGLPEQKLHLIRNGIDLDMVREDARDMRDELGLRGAFVVLFSGLIGVMQGVEIIIETAYLLQEHGDIRFLIVGDGVRKEAVAKRMRELDLTNVQMLSKQPLDQLPRLLVTADVCLATLANRQVTGVAPYKMLEAWAYRRPVIITDAGGEGGALAESCQAGLVTPAGDARALAKAILTLKRDQDLAKRLGGNGRRCIEKQLNRAKQARALEQVLLQVTHQQRNRSQKTDARRAF